MTLRRGFKAEAERIAAALRTDLGLRDTEAIDVRALANHLGADVVEASELVAMRRLEELERIQAFSFSACTFEIDDHMWIVVNPLRSTGRQASDIAHELSHRILAHCLDEIRTFDGVPFRTCEPRQEEEATVLGGTLLLPRPLLLAEAAAGAGPPEIARRYDVTEEMARFRFNSTGVARQVSQRRAPK